MKLLIDIPDEVYASAKNGELNEIQSMYICGSVCNGIPLPKGHGRLVDENYVIAELVYRKNLLADNVKCGQVTEIFNQAVVIDADKESNNETNN